MPLRKTPKHQRKTNLRTHGRTYNANTSLFAEIERIAKQRLREAVCGKTVTAGRAADCSGARLCFVSWLDQCREGLPHPFNTTVWFELNTHFMRAFVKKDE